MPPSARTSCATWTRANCNEGPAVKLLRLVFKNLFRHRLRTALTILGIATAVMAFGLIRTIVGAWNAGVTGAAANRMITRHRVSLIFPIPLPYRNEIARVPGVAAVSWANWFGGVYGDPNDFKNFWPRFAVDPDSYFDLYPEFQLPPDQLAAFKKERNACVIGRKLAQQHGFKLGDVITMEGDIYPGRWQWVVRGIYGGRDPSTDETQMFFQFAYLFEQVRQREPGRPVDAGVYVLRAGSADAMDRVAAAVLGLLLTFPIVKGFAKALPTFFPVINVAPLTMALGIGAALLAGLAAAAIPANRVMRMPIAVGLRTVG